MNTRRVGTDQGAVLVVALVVVLGLMIAVGSALTYASTGLRSSAPILARSQQAYDAYGATDVAINTLRTEDTAFDNTPGQDCFGDSSTLPVPSGEDGATITCAPKPGTGGSATLAPTGVGNKPANAILTLGQAAGEDGLTVTAHGQDPLKVYGPVFSNSTIRVTGGVMRDAAPVVAGGACDAGSIEGGTDCGKGAHAADPAYPAPTTLPPYRPLPACTTPSSVVTFQSGSYDDAAGLSAMMAPGSPCRGSTWWFAPGSYYFDFHNGEDPALPAGSHEWTVRTGTLVAGTPANGLAAPPVSPTVPGACVSPLVSTAASGVKFVFGGDSRLRVDGVKAEICGSYSAMSPPVAVYGLTSGTETTTTADSLPPTSLGVDFDWTGVSLNVSGFAPATPVPAGAHVDAMVFRTLHLFGPLPIKVVVAGITVKHPDGTTSPEFADAPLPLPVTTKTWHLGIDYDELDLSTIPALAKDVHEHGMASLRVKYRLTLDLSFGGLGSAAPAPMSWDPPTAADLVSLSLSYRAPAFRAETADVQGAPSCLAATPYTGSGGPCALVTTTGPDNRLFVQGTTYAPAAALDIALNRAEAPVFASGVVARTLRLTQIAGGTRGQALVMVPDDSPGYSSYAQRPPAEVVVTTYVCTGEPTCDPDDPAAQVRVRARVAITDPDPSAPVPGRRAVSVKSWSVRR